jgi:glycerate kinase
MIGSTPEGPPTGRVPRVLVAPASLKGVLSAREAAAALAEGIRHARVEAVELPVADGGEGTLDVLEAPLGGTRRTAEVHDAFGRPRCAGWLELPDGSAVVEAAQAIPLDRSRLEPMTATSRGLGELISAVGRRRRLIVGLGGSATVDGGSGLREVLSALPAPTTVACDVSVRLPDAARMFAAQKGATPAEIDELEQRLDAMDVLRPFADLPGAGAAGGLGAALAALGAELVAGAPLVLQVIGFDPCGFDRVGTGEGSVDLTAAEGKAPGAVLAACRAAGVRCAVFGGQVRWQLEGAEMHALSGGPSRATADLVELGERLARSLAARPEPSG